MKSLRLIIGASLVCAAVLVAQSPPSSERLFQEAIHLMETKGDYPGALRLFEQVAKGNDRNLAARALLHLGSCYEKLGKREARNAYARLIRDFADQPALVAAARARLAALTLQAGSPPSRGMAAHRILAEFPGPAALSHDGRRLSFTDWETGNLALLDLESKQKRSLTGNGIWVGESYGSVHSPTGKEIAYVWNAYQDSLELRVVGLDGTASRVLYRNPDLWQLEVHDWSFDGRYILCTFLLKNGKSQIALVSVGNGAAQVLKTFEWPGPGTSHLSPDGRYVAYDLPQRDGSLDRDVFLVATRGSHEAVLVEHPSNDLSPVWTPDGSRILFTSDRTGAYGIWILSVADGTPQGLPELLRADMGRTWPMRFAGEDSFYYGVQKTMMDVYVAELDPATGKVTAAPSQASRRLVGANSWPDWSPDGKLLAFVSNRSPGGRDLPSISIQSFETGRLEELYPRMTSLSRLRWSPDGRSILASGLDERGRGGLYRIDAQTGDVSPVVQSGGRRIAWDCAWSPDGRMVYYEFGQGIKARDLGTGQEREIHPDAHHFAPSPDGRFLAVGWADPSRKGVLEIVALDTGESRELLRVPDPSVFFKALNWSADGRFLFFGNGELWRVAVENGVSGKVGIAMHFVDVRVNPDGKKIAFFTQEFGGELWAMDRFLPAPEARKIAPESNP